jgi:hypothetical protein
VKARLQQHHPHCLLQNLLLESATRQPGSTSTTVLPLLQDHWLWRTSFLNNFNKISMVEAVGKTAESR